jgi:predicted PhzF superfamily epimerase YddE/YHI9
MTDAHILRVFVDKNDKFGDIAPVVIDEEKRIPDDKRQLLAGKIGAPETVFINSVADASISIMHSQGEIDFAGVGILGAAWLLNKLRNEPTQIIHGRGGDIRTWQNGEVTWVRAGTAKIPQWNYKQLASAGEVENIKLQETLDLEHTMVWAWIDEAKGNIRARTFAGDWDIPEAMGNGSGAMLLAQKLNRDIELRHGQGAVIFAGPAPNGQVDLGGRVVEEPSVTV